jgi:hypothetical protein
VWLTRQVGVCNGKPVEDLAKLATEWTLEIFDEFIKLEESKVRKGKGKGKGKGRHYKEKEKGGVTAVLRKSKQEGRSEFQPHELDGVSCINTIHYFDIMVRGLPEGKSQTNFQTVVKYREDDQGGGDVRGGQSTFSGTHGLFYWHWQDLRMVQDVIITFNDDVEKVKRVKAKLGTKVLDCQQAKVLAER